MTTICAYCKAFMSYDGNPDDKSVSHGCCTPCFKKQNELMDKAEAKDKASPLLLDALRATRPEGK